MKRFVATALIMAGTSLLPVLALHAQQPPPAARREPTGGENRHGDGNHAVH